MTGRFAPSPTGRMHLGNVYCAVMSWLSAKRQGGRWLLRIEDLDPQRSRREYALQIMDDLHWLGLDWDDEPLWQSERTEIYEHYYNELCARGIVYPCYCRRADLLAASAPHNADGMPVYAGTCRPATRLEAGSGGETVNTGSDNRQPAYRVIVPDRDITFIDLVRGTTVRNLVRDIGDFIVRRSDGVFAYQLAVVVDDALSGVTEVIRGDDLLTSAAQQIFLFETLGFAAPCYGHIPLLCAADGRRLSKRDRDMDMGHLRTQYTPQQVLGLVAHQAGLQPDAAPTTLSSLLSSARLPLQSKLPPFSSIPSTNPKYDTRQ